MTAASPVGERSRRLAGLGAEARRRFTRLHHTLCSAGGHGLRSGSKEVHPDSRSIDPTDDESREDERKGADGSSSRISSEPLLLAADTGFMSRGTDVRRDDVGDRNVGFYEPSGHLACRKNSGLVAVTLRCTGIRVELDGPTIARERLQTRSSAAGHRRPRSQHLHQRERPGIRVPRHLQRSGLLLDPPVGGAGCVSALVKRPG